MLVKGLQIPKYFKLPFHSPEDLDVDIDDKGEEGNEKEDLLDELNDDDSEEKDEEDEEEVDTKEKKEKKSKKDKESDEEDESEDDDNESDDDDDEEELARVSFKDITAKYPKFFKDFPELREAFFREQKFTQIFPTIEQAEEARDALDNFEQIQETVLSGDTARFLTNLNEANPKAFKVFIKNFLPTLQEGSNELFLQTINPYVRQYLNEVLRHGVNEKNNTIQNAAKVVHKIIFGGDYSDIDKNLEKPTRDKKEEPDERMEKFYQERHSELYRDVGSEYSSRLGKEIEKGLDPTGVIKSSYVKKKMIEEIVNKIGEELENDRSHMSRMNNYWEREKRNGFSGTMKESMLTTLLSRARTLLPKIRAEVRKDVLGNQKERDLKNTRNIKDRKDKLVPGSEGNNKRKMPSNQEAREKGMSMRDLIDT